MQWMTHPLSGVNAATPTRLAQGVRITDTPLYPGKSTIRRVCRDVKDCQDASMALLWAGAGMIEAAKGFCRLRAYKQLPILRTALEAHQAKHTIVTKLE
jgi:hypothetical protein